MPLRRRPPLTSLRLEKSKVFWLGVGQTLAERIQVNFSRTLEVSGCLEIFKFGTCQTFLGGATNAAVKSLPPR